MPKSTHEQSGPQAQPFTSWVDIPMTIRERLGGYGVHDLAGWVALSPRRRAQLFGITAPMRAQLDRLARLRS